jgi:predicted naringenin-chalcone synthase
MDTVILGLGTATPPYAITQARAAMLAKTLGRYTSRQVRLLDAVYQRSRIKRRGSVLFESGDGHEMPQSFFPPAAHETDRGPTTFERLERYAQEAPPLARAASLQALEAAAVRPQEITHLVTVSCTGFSSPGVDIRLTKELGLSDTVERTHVGFMGCHGAINGLRVADALARQRPEARVLVCAVELCSLHFRYGWHEQGLVSNALFADGAAACIMAPSQNWSGALRVQATGSCLLPDSEQMMGWRIGNHGFEMRLDPSVPRLVARHLRPWLGRWLAGQGLAIEAVGSWAIHPGGPRILRSVVSGLGLPEDAAGTSRAILEEHGNMSSPTVLFILQRLQRLQSRPPYVALAFGPGLVVEAALIG